jgi:aminoglycoside phosphotransferase (APT) family kinase protein
MRQHRILTRRETIERVRIVRHKRGRRCLVEYDIACDGEAMGRILGKMRAKRTDRATFELVTELRRRGFHEQSDDRIAVPEPVGTVPEFHMWLQRKIDGVSAFEELAKTDGAALAPRLADAIHKLHRADVPTARRHTAAEELAVLESLFDELAPAQPQWSRRLSRLLNACRRLLGELPDPPLVGIHRDFYPDQVLVAGDALYLLDLDLYCAGDPALDAGNFLGHMTEFCLRSFGDERAWADREGALEDRFVELTGAHCRRAVQAYHAVTLARHIALSQRFSDRRHCTEPLLDLCERRLGLGTSGRSAATVSPIHRLSIGG